MFYTLLDLIVCPGCREGLALLFSEEVPRRTSMRVGPASRIPPEGAAVGPLPETAAATPFREYLASRSAAAVSDGRGDRVEVISGLLVCPGCGRWYPVRDGLPELLPDHLRSPEEDRATWESFKAPAEAAGLSDLFGYLAPPESYGAPGGEGPDPGARFKIAEMSITRRKLPDGFFGPAAVAPFNPFTPLFSLDLIERFTAAARLLRAPLNGLVFDLGCGYGWTTEWLVRLGFQPVGMDICRDYILAGRPRMGMFLPHLIVGDVERIPLRPEAADAVLAFDAFHHIPGRRQALGELNRILKPGGRVVMMEPGPGHENHPRSIAVMEEHGILERGVDPREIEAETAGRGWEPPVSHPFAYESLVLLTLDKSGLFRTDSRAPRDLVARIALLSPSDPLAFDTGRPLRLELAIENMGDTLWLKQTPDGKGTVKLGAVLLNEKGTTVDFDYARLSLPRDLPPNQGLALRLTLPPIADPGSYVLEFDGLAEGLLWFKDREYRPARFQVLIRESAPGGRDEPFPSIEELDAYPVVQPEPRERPGSADKRPHLGSEEGPVGPVKSGWRRLRRLVGKKR
jgi:uncharacterized protein YbaR (Trm112 family)/SAM-dependent methyltransferase